MHELNTTADTGTPVKSHYQHVLDAIPSWVGKAPAQQQTELRQAKPLFAPWLLGAPASRHAQMKRLNAAQWRARNGLEERLQALQDINAFAKPLLEAAIRTQFGLTLDVEKTQLWLYVPLNIPWLPIPSGGARTWKVSLLDAALHNFEPDEAKPDAYEPGSTYVAETTKSSEEGETGRFKPLTSIRQQMPIPAFIQLCRELDIGGQYQRHLQQQLGIGDTVATRALQRQVSESQEVALKAALHLALMKKDISAQSHSQVLGLLDGLSGMQLDGQPLCSHDLKIMDVALTGIVLFAPDFEQAQHTVPLVAYIPDDPQGAIKEYASSTLFSSALTQRLREKDCQQFFSRFVGHQERPLFFFELNQRLASIQWHRPAPGDSRPPWRETPADKPNLLFSAQLTPGDLMRHLYQGKLNKILNDARTIAVSTASADRNARWKRWDALSRIASELVSIAAFIATPFFPPLGALMLGYAAYQLLDDTFEGIIDWAEGLKQQAFEHLMSVMETLVELGGFVVGVPIAEGMLRQALPKQLWTFIDNLMPVTRPDGQQRLWSPDLTPYHQDIEPVSSAGPDQLGLHEHLGRKILKLDAQRFVVRQDAGEGIYQIEHPAREDAYAPQLSHNGAGAWRTELDRPLTWDDTTLVRRLGQQTDAFSDEQLQQMLTVSGTHPDALRKLHINNEPPPPLLADTLERFKVAQDLQRFVDLMGSDDPLLYRSADVQTQIQLLTSYGLLLSTRGLRFLDGAGKVAWSYPPASRLPMIDIPEAQMNNGAMLDTIIQGLSEPEIKTLLDEEPGLPPTSLGARTTRLRQQMAKLANDKWASLFETRYSAKQVPPDPAARNLMDRYQGLPRSVAEELLRTATVEEYKGIGANRFSPRIDELARWTLLETRTVRAYEGLYIDNLGGADTDRLVLHSLDRLLNWSAEVRLDMRAYSFRGTLHDSVGAPQAKIVRTLVRGDDRRYTPFDDAGLELHGPTDIYQGVLQALPDAQRNALGIHIGQGERLRQAIGRSPLDLDSMRVLLASDPVRKPHYDSRIMRLPGGMDGYRPGAPASGPSASPTPEERAQDLFPTFNAEQIRNLVRSLESRPGGANSTLVALQQSYSALEVDLSRWVSDTPQPAAGTGVIVSASDYQAARLNRQRWAEEIKRCLRRETELDEFQGSHTRPSHVLELEEPMPGPLPPLRMRFTHVTYLQLAGDSTTEGLVEFLQAFPGLRHLDIDGIPIRTLPEQITSLPDLGVLTLNNCRITLDANSHAALSSMTRLRVLDLSDNPLGGAPDVSRMAELRQLKLRNTGIDQVPTGLETRPHLTTARLERNRITDLPPALFELPGEVSKKIDLTGNPLSRAALDRVKAYALENAEHMSVDAPHELSRRVQALYPSLSRRDANRFIFSLPGTLDEVPGGLSRLESELAQLTADLERWRQDVFLPDPIALTQEQLRRSALKEKLVDCWQRDFYQDPAELPDRFAFAGNIHGAMPRLDARFEHITTVDLQGGVATTGVDGLLQCFPNLQTVNVADFNLGQLPESIFNIPQLTDLTLQNCRIRLTPADAGRLAGLTGLEDLDLSGNPLGTTPEVWRMTRLKTLLLPDSQLTRVPEDVFSMPTLLTLDLSNNLITDLPVDILEMSAETGEDFELDGNPFSEQGLGLLRIRYQQTGNDMGVAAARLDAQGNPLQTHR
ncbi:leucine-rich repeat domain-containing protein [Pseudomonas sp. Z1-29]|uniref:dermonecrotic toxin domain-containing protein n=1 Tax=Pseudomonas sp. Z1-29 TaxID=2817410 RepID=UPI003DA8E1F8